MLATFLGVAVLIAGAAAQSASPPASPPAGDTMARLQQTVDWYHSVESAGVGADAGADAASRARVHEAAVQVLQLAFDVARANAAAVRDAAAGAAGQPAVGTAGNLSQINQRFSDRTTALEQALDGVNRELARASHTDRAALESRRDAITGALDLVKTLQTSVQQVMQFAAASQSADRGAGTLAAQIDALERTVPEARHAPAAPTPKGSGATPAAGTAAAPAPAPPAAFQPDSAGIVALATHLVALSSARRTLAGVVRSTSALVQSVEEQRTPLAAELRQILQRADAASSNAATDAASPGDLRADVARVRQASATLVPLAEEGLALQTVNGALVTWRTDLGAREAATSRYLILRVLALVIAIVVLLAGSEAWRRATLRYLEDPHRRRQLQWLRRIVVGAALTFILVVAFVSQIGSLATYAGFVTAGVAVALQNVILAVVAYFLLIGRHGVRVGDRVTIGGVTGRVVEIGLIRIYLMELAAPDWHPTGRIVVYSNAVFFQPSALFKQMPGVDYGWHSLALTASPSADLARAEHTIREAVERAYAPFRDEIDAQHQALQTNVDVQTPAPGPDVQIRFASDGVQIVVRYPVVRSRATEMDNRMIAALRDAVAAAPGIPLTESGAPKLQADMAA